MRRMAMRRTIPRCRGSDRSDRSDGGFTLVELLVVLAILGLLVAIATPQVLRSLDRARISTARIQVESFSSALDLYKLDVGRYPTTSEGLSSLIKMPASVRNWNGPYVKVNADLNDPWGRLYKFHSPGEHGAFDLFSLGPDGNEGGDGAGKAITNW